MMEKQVEFPVHEKVKVLDGVTIFKTEKWWMAVLKVDSFGKTSVNVYLWVKRGDRWKRQQKLTIRGKEQWNLIRETVEKLIEA